jgi:hypothetical protein
VTADVYAGDDALNVPGAEGHGGLRVLFVARADPDAGLLLKVATAVRPANRLPVALTLVRDTVGMAVVSVELESVTTVLADLVRRKLEQLVDVHSVELAFLSEARQGQD